MHATVGSPRLSQVNSGLLRWCASGVAGFAVMASVTACGFDAQTLQPYPQAEGVNFQIGPSTGTDPVLKVRDLLVVSDKSGNGFLSASMIMTSGTDRLVSVTGEALKPNGSSAGALTVAKFSPIQITSTKLAQLVNLPEISVSSASLKAGLTARLVLSFATAGNKTLVVPVADGTGAPFTTVSPSPAG